jgi:predicted transcriptional regulator of viral defense system
MARAGALKKVGPGRYRLATSTVTEGHSLVLACSLVPSSVACLSTALLFHNLGTQLPREVCSPFRAALTTRSANLRSATIDGLA